jgi:uncharacterized protein YdaU (DUF1376 family)
MNYYSHHIGDFNSATRHLTLLERGVYRDLLDLYYDTERPLSTDIEVLARRICARSEQERVALRIVLDEFFELGEDGYRNKRCDEELEAFAEKSAKCRRAGAAGASKRWDGGRMADAKQTLGERQADATRTPSECHTDAKQTPDGRHSGAIQIDRAEMANQYPITNTQEPREKKARVRAQASEAAVIPTELDSDEFRVAWGRWVEYRKSLRRVLTIQTMNIQLSQLAKVGTAKAIACIDASIAAGWQGLFPFSENKSKTSTHTSNDKSEYATDW